MLTRKDLISMATTKIWPIKDSLKRVTDYAANPDKTEYDDLKKSISYAVNGEKTEVTSEKVYLVTGVRCDAETAFEEMSAVKKAFGKTGGNVAYHAYQSFKPGEIASEECHKVGIELAERLWGDRYQVLVATHLDKEHLHNHFIINSVSFVDGKKFNDNKAAYRRMREVSDELCRDHTLSVIEHPRGRTPRQLYFAEKNGAPTIYNQLRSTIDEAISMSTNIEMFESVLRMKSYRIKADPSRKYPVICSVYGGKPTRLYHLGEEYDPQRIYERICLNDIEAAEKYYRFLDERRRAYQPVTARSYCHHPKRKLTGLYGLYIRCLYQMGYLPKHSSYQPLTPEMKAALRKCDEYSRQARLIGEEHLENTADAEKLIKKYDDKIERLCEERQKIRNKLRRCKDPDTINDLKEQRNALTSEIKEIRGKRFTAVQIIERADKIHEDVARETAAKKQERELYIRKKDYRIR